MNTQTNNARGTFAEKEEDTVQYLTFLLGDETYAMEIGTVREIIQSVQMTTVPLMPDYVRGLINLRGAVVPVIDLKSRFGWSKTVARKKTCIIIFDLQQQGERQELGLLVDAVSEIVDLGPSQVEPAPQFGGSIRKEYMCGVGKIGGRFVVIIDPKRALNIDDMTAAMT